VYTPNGVATGIGPLVVERVLARRAARIIAVSPSEATLLHERHIASPPRVQVIPNGIERETPVSSSPVDLRARLQLPAATPLVGTVSRLVVQKAPERFVALAAAVHRLLPDAHFVLIGDGTLRAQVDDAVTTSGVGQWFHRLAEIPDAAAVVGQLDVFVLTSRFEGGPYTPLEAMRAGVPVVLSDVVGNRDVVEPGHSGFLVPEGAIATMASVVVDLLTDDDQRVAVGWAGQARVQARFDLVSTGRALAAVYGSLVAQPPDHL
jgi:glycosyltransferase involved in cell wall biosynthesis